MGKKFGAVAWSGGGQDRGVCVHICWGLCRSWWDVSASPAGIFASKDPCAVPSSCLSSAWRSRLEASSGLRSAPFSVVYGQVKWNCPHGQLVRAPCCQTRLSVMLPNAHGHRIIYILDSPFCLIKKKKKIILYLKQNQPVLSPPTPHSIMIKIAT